MGKGIRVKLAAGLVAALLMIGLSGVPSAQAASTRAEYIGEVDPICAESLQGQNSALKGVLSDVRHGNFKKAARKFRRAGSLFSAGIDKLALHEPPEADRALIDSWLQGLRSQVPLIKNYAKALADANAKRFRRATKQIIAASASTQALVRDYGFQVCDSM